MIRKVFISMAILFGALTTVLADDDKPVTIDQLPTKAKSYRASRQVTSDKK